MGVFALIIIIIVVQLQGLLFKKFAFRSLEYKCEFNATEAFEGDEIQLIETVQNRKFLPVPWLKVNINTSRWLEFAETRSVISQESRFVTSGFYLGSKQKIVRRWKLKCLKRGIFKIDNVSLLSGDLLGIKTSSIPASVNINLKVYPSILDLNKAFMPTNFLQGDNIVKRWIIDDPFIVSGAREYSSSDSMSRIHWRATAKEGKLMVKKNDFTSQLSLSVVLNVQSLESEYFETVYKDVIEYGIKVTASIFDNALKAGMPVRFACNGSTDKNSKTTIFSSEAAGKEHVCTLLEILAELKLVGVIDFEDFLEEISFGMSNSDVIFISSYLNEGIIEKINKIKSAQNRVSVILLRGKENLFTEIPKDLDIHFLVWDGEQHEG